MNDEFEPNYLIIIIAHSERFTFTETFLYLQQLSCSEGSDYTIDWGLKISVFKEKGLNQLKTFYFSLIQV